MIKTSDYHRRPISEGAKHICNNEKVTRDTYERKTEINNLEQLNSKNAIIDFLHTALFSPVKLTWL